MSNTVRQCRKSPIGMNPKTHFSSYRKFHRLNPETAFELIEEGYRIPDSPCDNSNYTPNNEKK